MVPVRKISRNIAPILIFCILSLPVMKIESQIASGAWRDHLPYSHADKLAEFDNRIFCSTLDGSLYSYNLKDKTLKKHSKANGLSDAEISTIGASDITGTLFIGYTNGNIDLVRNDSVYNVPDIKRKMINGEKIINNVFFHGQYAYLACGFGIVLFDLARREIKDTYFFGTNGSQIFVNAITSDGTHLYAATKQGIYRADLNDPNLLDFNAWHHITSLPNPDGSYRFLAWYNNTMITVTRDPVTGSGNIITFDESGWQVWDKSYTDVFDYLGEQQGFLKFSSSGVSKVYGDQENLIREFVSYGSRFVLIDSNNGLWYASAYGGMAGIDAQGNGAVYVPDGPAYRETSDIEISQGKLWAGGGTNNAKGSGFGAYYFYNEKWTQYNRGTFPPMKDFLNIAEVAIDPHNPDHIVGGSFGYGIIEFSGGQLIHIEDDKTGVLHSVAGLEDIPGYILITGIDFDKDGNAYAVASETKYAAYKKSVGGEWMPIKLNYSSFGRYIVSGKLLADKEGQIWLILPRSGILIFTEENGTSTREKFIDIKTKENPTFENIFSIAEDKDGNIWVGTEKGPVIYSNPAGIFDENVVVGYQPIIPRNDGTTFGSLLLASEQINDIAVDGANRKWLATEKSGVFLVSPDGKKEISHFTEENSPLLSNSVQTIGVNDKTGEVFFGTSRGMISYRGTATEGGEDFKNVYVFPNPVRENYNGNITVTGLVSDVNVKITDIAGNLVFETTALGGQAVWNGKNFRGDRVQTGVYLVFCTNEDGSKTFVTKLLFIH